MGARRHWLCRHRYDRSGRSKAGCSRNSGSIRFWMMTDERASVIVPSSPYPTSIVTKAWTPLLDVHANPVAGVHLAGATTIELTNAERKQASSRSQLWAQGGTPDDPVLAHTYPERRYGFGALRCANSAVRGAPK